MPLNLAITGALALGGVVGYVSRYFFPLFRNFNVRSLGGLLGCMFAGSGVGYLTKLLSSPDTVAVYPIGLVIGVVAYGFFPIADRQQQKERGAATLLDRFRHIDHRAESDFRMFIFGLGRSGKTTLIKQLLYAIPPDESQEITETFHVYHGVVTLEPESPPLHLSIADYKGQKPSQVLTNAPEDFFGPRSHRLTNVLIFQVDLVPEFIENNVPLTDEEILAKYAAGAMRKVQDRIAKHVEHLSSGIVELVFSVAVSKNLRAVRLLINKIDLVNQMIDRGYLGDTDMVSMKEVLTKKLAPVISRVEKACVDTTEFSSIDTFTYHFISAKEGYNVRAVFGPLFRRESDRLKTPETTAR
jgi:hypothetical protein